MSTTNTSNFMFQTDKLTIIIGIPILVAGLLGDILNCIVFLSLKTFRETTCAFYFIVLSFVNIGQLLTSLFPRIMSVGFDIDWASNSAWYCRLRIYILQFCTLMSYTAMCLATIDQFLTTCINPRWQQISTIKLSRLLSAIFVFVWVLHGIPFLIYLDTIESPVTHQIYCVVKRDMLLQYFHYGFIVLLSGFVPVIITLLFGFLAYRNVTQLDYRTVPIIRRELDKQLSTMVFIQVIYNCFATIPYIIMYILMRIPALVRQPFLNAQLALASSVLILLYYTYYAVRINQFIE